MAPNNTTPLKGVTSTSPITTGNVRSYRRGSTGLFSGLINQKRNGADVAAQARRASFHDMKPSPGFIGRMWHKYLDLDPRYPCTHRTNSYVMGTTSNK